jgi:hypothetical protein
MNVNNNDISLDRFKGEIKPCPLCSNRTPSAALDALTSGRACTMCMGQGSIAMCTNCEGTGSYKGRTIWDGGRNEHASTCTPCGGKGCFPSRIPASAKVVENEAPVMQ